VAIRHNFKYSRFKNSRGGVKKSNMMCDIDLYEAAEQVGISSDAFQKRLNRLKLDFKDAIVAMNNEQK
jgi:hypothetical protein